MALTERLSRYVPPKSLVHISTWGLPCIAPDSASSTVCGHGEPCQKGGMCHGCFQSSPPSAARFLWISIYMTVVSDSHYQSAIDASYVYVVPWSEFPVVHSYPHYPHLYVLNALGLRGPVHTTPGIMLCLEELPTVRTRVLRSLETPTPIGSPQVPRHRATAGSYGGMFLMSEVPCTGVNRN